MKLPPAPRLPGPDHGSGRPPIGGLPEAAHHDGKADEMVHDCKGNAKKLASMLKHAPEALRDEARAAAASQYGNAFVAELEEALDHGIKAGAKAISGDESKARGMVGELDQKLQQLKGAAKSKGMKQFGDLEQQVGAFESVSARIAAAIVGAGANADWALLTAVLETMLAVAAVVIAIVLAVGGMGLTGVAGAAMLAGAVVIIAAAVAMLAVTIVVNLGSLEKGLSVILNAVGAHAAANEADKAGAEWNDNVASQAWFQTMTGGVLALSAVVTELATLGSGNPVKEIGEVADPALTAAREAATQLLATLQDKLGALGSQHGLPGLDAQLVGLVSAGAQLGVKVATAASQAELDAATAEIRTAIDVVDVVLALYAKAGLLGAAVVLGLVAEAVALVAGMTQIAAAIATAVAESQLAKLVQEIDQLKGELAKVGQQTTQIVDVLGGLRDQEGNAEDRSKGSQEAENQIMAGLDKAAASYSDMVNATVNAGGSDNSSGPSVDWNLAQARADVQTAAHDAGDRAGRLEAAGAHGFASLMHRIHDDAMTMASSTGTATADTLAGMQSALGTIVAAADKALGATVPSVVAAMSEGGAGAMALAMEICISIADGGSQRAQVTAAQGCAQKALDAANAKLSDLASGVQGAVDAGTQATTGAVDQGIDTVKSWF